MNTIKNFYFLFLILFVFNSCSNDSFSVEADTNHSDDLNIFLVKIGDSNFPVVIDSTKVLNGKFSFNDKISIPEMHYIVFENQRENLPVVLEPGTIKVNVYKDSIRSSKVKGTKSNDDFNKYKTTTKEFYLELNNIQKLHIKNLFFFKKLLCHCYNANIERGKMHEYLFKYCEIYC